MEEKPEQIKHIDEITGRKEIVVYEIKGNWDDILFGWIKKLFTKEKDDEHNNDEGI